MTKQEILNNIMMEIENIPPMPQTILQIQKLIQNPNAHNYVIAQYIKRDPALTADILRISNSAWYAQRTRVDTVERSITIVGLDRLSSIIATIGAKQILSDRYQEMESIWEHCFKCGCFSQSLMKFAKREGEELDSAYICGLLHDIGKIVLLSMSPEFFKKLQVLSKTKNISISAIEKISLGISHGEIGKIIGEKWNFPHHVTSAIAYHHDPLSADVEYRALTFSVYLANILANRSNETTPSYSLEGIEEKVLEFFQIDTEGRLSSIMLMLKNFYEHQTQVHKVS